MTDQQMFSELLTRYFIPQWFSKETFEVLLDRQISDEQWENFLECETCSMAESVEYVVAEFARDIADEYFGGE